MSFLFWPSSRGNTTSLIGISMPNIRIAPTAIGCASTQTISWNWSVSARKSLNTIAVIFAARLDSSIGLPTSMAESHWQRHELPVYCTVPWQRFELKANGDVKICPFFHEPIGSINGSSFPDIWNGMEFRHIRQAFTYRTGLPSCCVNCKFDLRRQYLPGYPGIPESGLLGWGSESGP